MSSPGASNCPVWRHFWCLRPAANLYCCSFCPVYSIYIPPLLGFVVPQPLVALVPLCILEGGLFVCTSHVVTAGGALI